MDYLEKSKHLQDQLRDLRSEIEVLKVGEKQSEFDIIHDEQVRMGENKYSTLKRVNDSLLVLDCSDKMDSSLVYKILQWRLMFVYPVGTPLSVLCTLKIKSPIAFVFYRWDICNCRAFFDGMISNSDFRRVIPQWSEKSITLK